MKGTNLGELEELILLTVAALYNMAYGVAIQQYINKHCDRSITISTTHAALKRLQQKGFLVSRYGEATPERGGRRKLLFTVTSSGHEAITKSRSIRNRLWNAIPKIAFE